MQAVHIIDTIDTTLVASLSRCGKELLDKSFLRTILMQSVEEREYILPCITSVNLIEPILCQIY
jgi:hypothetical protein